MRIQRYYSGGASSSESLSDDEPAYANDWERGYALCEKPSYRIAETRRQAIHTYEKDAKNAGALFAGIYEPNNFADNWETSSSLGTKLDLLLLSKWISFSSGFNLPCDDLKYFCLALQDGVVLSKLIYNFFLGSSKHTENYSPFDEQANFIKENLILNPTSDTEMNFNFEIFNEACKRIGVDSFNCLKRSHLMGVGKESTIVYDRLFLLEASIFRASGKEMFDYDAEIDEVESMSTFGQYFGHNLKEFCAEEEIQIDIQRKRLTSYYMMALKQGQRILSDRLKIHDDLCKTFGEEEEEVLLGDQTYLHIAGRLSPPKGFWNFLDFFSREESNAMMDNESTVAIEEVGSTSTASSVEMNEETKLSIHSKSKNHNRRRRKQPSVAPTESRSAVYYVVESDEDDMESEIMSPKDDEVISLSSKLDLLIDDSVDNEEAKLKSLPKQTNSIASVRSRVYYIIEEFNEVNKDLSKMADDVLHRLSALKSKDREVRLLETYSHTSQGITQKLESENENEIDRAVFNKEIDQIRNLLDNVKVLKDNLVEAHDSETINITQAS